MDDDQWLRVAARELGVGEDELRRQWRAWDLELLDDLELGVVSVAQHRDPLELLTLPEVAAILKRGLTSVKGDIAAGRLRTVKLGRSTRVPRAELERYIADALDATEGRRHG